MVTGAVSAWIFFHPSTICGVLCPCQGQELTLAFRRDPGGGWRVARVAEAGVGAHAVDTAPSSCAGIPQTLVVIWAVGDGEGGQGGLAWAPASKLPMLRLDWAQCCEPRRG